MCGIVLCLCAIFCYVLTVCFLITGCGMWMIDRSKFEFHPDFLIDSANDPFYKKIFLETLNMLKSNSNILKLVLHSVSQSFFLRRRNSNHDMKQNPNRQFFCQCIHKLQHSLCNGILRFDPLTQQPPSLIETDDDGTHNGCGRDGWLGWWSSCRWWGALLCHIFASWFLVLDPFREQSMTLKEHMKEEVTRAIN